MSDFKSQIISELAKIQDKLNTNKEITEDESYLLLLSSLIEEES